VKLSQPCSRITINDIENIDIINISRFEIQLKFVKNLIHSAIYWSRIDKDYQ